MLKIISVSTYFMNFVKKKQFEISKLSEVVTQACRLAPQNWEILNRILLQIPVLKTPHSDCYYKVGTASDILGHYCASHDPTMYYCRCNPQSTNYEHSRFIDEIKKVIGLDVDKS